MVLESSRTASLRRSFLEGPSSCVAAWAIPMLLTRSIIKTVMRYDQDDMIPYRSCALLPQPSKAWKAGRVSNFIIKIIINKGRRAHSLLFGLIIKSFYSMYIFVNFVYTNGTMFHGVWVLKGHCFFFKIANTSKVIRTNRIFCHPIVMTVFGSLSVSSTFTLIMETFASSRLRRHIMIHTEHASSVEIVIPGKEELWPKWQTIWHSLWLKCWLW